MSELNSGPIRLKNATAPASSSSSKIFFVKHLLGTIGAMNPAAARRPGGSSAVLRLTRVLFLAVAFVATFMLGSISRDYTQSELGHDQRSACREPRELQDAGRSALRPTAARSPKATTTAMPLGDAYPHDDTYTRSGCKNNVRALALRADAWLRAAFIPDTRVLAWSEHATAQEYERLKRFQLIYGWGGKNFSLVATALRLLNTSANRHMFDDWSERWRRQRAPACVACAVVGNGGILNGSRLGREIDKHHYVFRVNAAMTRGYEDDVGSRTSFYFFSTNTMRNSLGRYRKLGYTSPPNTPETRYVFIPDSVRDYQMVQAAITNTPVAYGRDRSKLPPTFFGSKPGPEKFKMLHPDFSRYLRNRFMMSSRLKGRLRVIYRPSTGAMMLLTALHTCDVVDAYGFLTEDYTRYSCYYYDKVKHAVPFVANHDMKLELALWARLHKSKMIRLYMGKGD
ncbi:alpha-N-acetylgalactosaminide alpha-2,6-sialyltransferase 2-like isoform X1 [Petromyzon marinus]|uniref:alpha-N-acetylgalactosaminide alpha-2,6-sialyltransferase 2-like isoform X1 n=2 Tax=Petromyzon marinus TaxID=7757 RepID=UPI003F715A60